GTVLRRSSAETFNQFAADTATREEAIALADAWIGALTRGLPRGLPPKEFDILAIDAATEAAAPRMLSPTERLVWIRVLEGKASFMGDAEAEVSASGIAVPIPVRNDVWLRVTEPVRAESADPRELAARGELWDSLAAYHRLALAYFLSAARRTDAAEASRIEEKFRRSQAVMSDALSRIVRVVAGGAMDVPAVPGNDPLLAALAPIGAREGIEFRLPKDSATALDSVNRVQEVADATQVRMRQVALKGEWWLGDNGPLLASYRETKQWVALVPRRNGRYELHDPATGRVSAVDEVLAESLGDFAYSFFRALPAKKLNLLDLLRFSFHGRGYDLTWVVGLSALAGILGMMIPVATGKLIDTFIPSADRDAVAMTMAALVAAAIASAMFGIARSVAVLRAESLMNGSLQGAVWDRLLKLPVPFFRDFSSGDLALRISGVNTIRHALSGSTLGTLLSSIFSTFNFALLYYYNAKLALVATGMTLLAVIVTLACGYARLRYERQISEVAGRLSGTVFQYLTGMSKLRVASAETRAFANWVRQFTRLRRLSFAAAHVGNIQGAFFSVYGLATTGVIFAMVGLSFAEALEKATTGGGAPPPLMTTGEFVAFNAAFGSFTGALLSIASTAIGLLNLIPVYTRAKPILETLPEVDGQKAHPGQLAGGLEVVKVGFGYRDGPAILKDVSFSIRPGGYIALVGPSGSGKSTLFRLLLGFEKPTSGSIYFDNQDLADLDVQAIRKQIGVVLQGGQLMSGDIFTNIVGASQLSIDDAWEAARLCGLEDDIKKMPMGMHTVVSEGSSTLSGGQRQRILIARAVVNRPRIIFFDEATSALDNRTQAIVSHSLETLKATRVVIAHRLSTIINADRILVLKDGAIVQNGSYQKLVNEPGPFAELAKRQIA
ncbi:MAG: NHLP bacteriocin export ABC transporter permease/ATPase subunit, partial [Burkholderiales bacterium]